MISAKDVILASPAGTMIYAQFRADDAEEMETGFLVHARAARIARIPPNPTVEVRTGIFFDGDVVLLAVMVRIGEEMYETWFNYCQRMPAASYLRDWSEQATIAIVFHDERGNKARSVRLRNPLSEVADQVREICSNGPSWTMREFDDARAKLYATYSRRALWDAIGSDPP